MNPREINRLVLCISIVFAGCTISGPYLSRGDKIDISTTRGNHEEHFKATVALGYLSGYLSWIAYFDFDQELRATLERKGFSDIRFLEHQETHTFGIVCRLNDVSIVAFRGTTTLPDWQTNLKFRALGSTFKEFKVHRGFYAAWAGCESDVIATLEKHRNAVGDNNHRIIFTGHSLGGAVALIGARRLSDIGYPVDAAITFGQPRVFALGLLRLPRALSIEGNSRTNLFRPESYRFVLPGDPVPIVPPRLFSYFHVGREFRLQESGVDFLLHFKAKTASIGQHQMLRYRNALYKAGWAQQPEEEYEGTQFEQYGKARVEEYKDQERLAEWTKTRGTHIRQYLGKRCRQDLDAWVDLMHDAGVSVTTPIHPYFTDQYREYRYGKSRFEFQPGPPLEEALDLILGY